MRRVVAILGGLYLVAAAAWVVRAGMVSAGGPVEVLHVACDPTRELWHDVNAAFLARVNAGRAEPVAIRQSHGGSGSQARSVIDGLDADVVSLALYIDTQAVHRAGKIDAGWVDRFPNRSLPFVSTIVFVVRRGNPKGIHDWPDLAREDITVMTPNPKTSGNGKWSFLALWGSVVTAGGSDEAAYESVRSVFARVPVLDTSARASTLSFSQKRLGDVHLTWENEAHLEVAEASGELEIVVPPRSILAEPHVAVVDAVARAKGTEAVAEDYMRFLYTEEAQRIIARHHYRPTHEGVRRETLDQFPAVDLFTVRDIDPDWDRVQARFFAAGGLFERMFGPGERP